MYTTISVLIPILTLNIQEAVLRFALDKKYHKNALITVAVRYYLQACCLSFIILFFIVCFDFITLDIVYVIFIFLLFASHALSGIIIAYIRGNDKIKELSISSVLSSLVAIGCNILFLVYFKWGLYGYFLANIVGPLLQCLYLMISTHILRNVHLQNKYSQEKKEMLSYSKPLIANSLFWWISNASDRYVIVFFCGIAENGIYSLSSKIPSILNIVQTIFNQAWILSAVKEFDSEDKSGFFANTYKAYNCIMVVLCSAIILTDKLLARILYAKEFFIAWRYVPWLTIAVVFGALSGYLGGFFTAVKNSKIYAQSTVVGAAINIVMNFIFTPLIGSLGAAIATSISYIVVWVIRYSNSKQFIKLRIRFFRDILTYIILIIQAAILLCISNDYLLYVIEGGLFIFIFLLYGGEIHQFACKFQIKIKEQG